MREIERDSGEVLELERNRMSALRLDQIIEKTFRLRFEHGGRIRGSNLHRETQFVRDVRNGQAAFTLG